MTDVSAPAARQIETLPRSFTLLPLAGSLTVGYDLFAYFIVGSYPDGLDITSPTWLSRCYLLNEMDLVNLHLPFKVGERFYTKGMVESVHTLPGKKDKVFRLRFTEQPPQHYPYFIDMKDKSVYVIGDRQLINMFLFSVRECILLKKGVAVYIKHLGAYFSRLVGHRLDNYAQFNQFFFKDILDKLQTKIHSLEVLQTALMADAAKGDLSSLHDFQGMHDLIATEVNLDLISMTFSEGDHVTYITAIKDLEENLYWQYNGMLLIYEYYVRKLKEKPSAT